MGTQCIEIGPMFADCSMPPEFCSFSGARFEKCKPWLRDNFPELYPELFGTAAAPSDAAKAGGSASSAGADAALPAAMAALAVGGKQTGPVDGAGVPLAAGAGAAEATKRE